MRWVQVSHVGVEALIFPELVNSDIMLTNARGTTGINIAEHVMALILAFGRTLHITVKRQMEKVWEIRPNLPVMEVAGDTPISIDVRMILLPFWPSKLNSPF